MGRQISVTVNDMPISMGRFVEGFVEHTVTGMMASLDGIGEISRLDIAINHDDVTITINGEQVQITAFVAQITRSTIIGMISTLHGVGLIERVNISVIQ